MTAPRRGTGAAGNTQKLGSAILARRRVSYRPGDVPLAIDQLERAGFKAYSEIELLPYGCVMIAFNPQTGDGFPVCGEDVGPIARLGLAAMDPYGVDDNDQRPRWQRPDQKDRHRKYAEAVLARARHEVATARAGGRNNAFASAAFTLGRFVLDATWGVSERDATAALTDAARAIGLDEREIIGTVKRGLERGAENPKDPRDLQDEPTPQEPPDRVAQHLRKLSQRTRGKL